MVARLILLALTIVRTELTATPPRSAIAQAEALVAGADPAEREELGEALGLALVRQGRTGEAEKLAATLPPVRHAAVILALAERLPTSESARAGQFLLEAQTDRALIRDWHKSRIARLLAVAHARLGRLEAAEAMAREVPDAEDRAFALRDVVIELCRVGEITRARELAAAIEENRRYGTYRQKAAALSAVSSLLHSRGDAEGAATLLAQAELLLPKKPGWSDGEALLSVGVAAHACGQTAKATELLTRVESLARGIAGAWKVSELAAVAAAWREVGEKARAADLLAEAEKFLTTLPAFDRAPEALALARAHAAAGDEGKARELVTEALVEARREEKNGAGRAAHVRVLLAWTEIAGEAAVP